MSKLVKICGVSILGVALLPTTSLAAGADGVYGGGYTSQGITAHVTAAITGTDGTSPTATVRFSAADGNCMFPRQESKIVATPTVAADGTLNISGNIKRKIDLGSKTVYEKHSVSLHTTGLGKLSGSVTVSGGDKYSCNFSKPVQLRSLAAVPTDAGNNATRYGVVSNASGVNVGSFMQRTVSGVRSVFFSDREHHCKFNGKAVSQSSNGYIQDPLRISAASGDRTYKVKRIYDSKNYHDEMKTNGTLSATGVASGTISEWSKTKYSNGKLVCRTGNLSFWAVN